MPEDLKDAIAANANGPAEVQGDEGRVKQHPLPDQILADQHLKRNAAAKKPHRGVRFTKLISPGPT